MNQYAIEVQQVEKRFGGVHALKSINLQVQAGSIHAIIGENGAGKSTLMKILSGIYTKDSGKIFIHGEEKTSPRPFTVKRAALALFIRSWRSHPILASRKISFSMISGWAAVLLTGKN